MDTLLKTIETLDRAFDRVRSDLPLSIKLNESTPRIRVRTGLKAHTDSEGYEYPETIEVKIENQSNSWYSYRVRDGRFIGEGCDLQGPGISGLTLIKRQIREYQGRCKFLKLHKQATECNGLVFGDSIVVVENVDSHYWCSRYSPVWEIETDQGKSSWYGSSPGDALNNAARFIKGTPQLIRLKTFSGRFGEKATYRQAKEIFKTA